MSTARTITLQVADADLITSEAWTHFRLRFRVKGAAAWTDFFTTGSTLEALDVALLTSGAYTLDGLNGPTGNEALASAAGNEYSSQGENAGGLGNWSKPFDANEEPDSYGPLADVSRLTRSFADLKTMLDFPSQEEADVFLGECLVDGSDELRENALIDAIYTGGPTDVQSRILAAAELLMAKAIVWDKAGDMKASGMQAPLLMEDSTVMAERAEMYRTRALGRLTGLLEGETSAPNVRFLFPFSASDERVFARDTEW